LFAEKPDSNEIKRYVNEVVTELKKPQWSLTEKDRDCDK
jgi:hypothetical protein